MSTGWTTKTTWRCRYGHCHRNLFGKPTQPASRVVHNTCEGGGGRGAGRSIHRLGKHDENNLALQVMARCDWLPGWVGSF
jgi:hypothetical protein